MTPGSRPASHEPSSSHIATGSSPARLRSRWPRAFAATAAWLDDVPDLGVGLHLAAVGEDPPLLSASEVPTLVDRNGHLTLSSLRMVPRLAASRVDPADLESEFTAQYDAFCATGRAPTHLDTHHNLHH